MFNVQSCIFALNRYKYTYYLRNSEQNFSKNARFGDNYLFLCLLCPFLLEGWWGNATNSIKEQERKIAPSSLSMCLRNTPALQGRAGEGPYSLTFGRALFATRHSRCKHHSALAALILAQYLIHQCGDVGNTDCSVAVHVVAVYIVIEQYYPSAVLQIGSNNAWVGTRESPGNSAVTQC